MVFIHTLYNLSLHILFSFDFQAWVVKHASRRCHKSRQYINIYLLYQYFYVELQSILASDRSILLIPFIYISMYVRVYTIDRYILSIPCIYVSMYVRPCVRACMHVCICEIEGGYNKGVHWIWKVGKGIIQGVWVRERDVEEV